jgi:hypothetical protein
MHRHVGAAATGNWIIPVRISVTCCNDAVQVMKMFMPMLAPAAGTLRWRLPEGSILAPGDLIATLDLTDPGAVTQAEPFTGPSETLSCSVSSEACNRGL